MRLVTSRFITLLALAAGLCIGAPAQAQGAAEAPPAGSAAQGGIDPAWRSALTGVATALVTEFALRLAAGSAEGFDPGPALERAAARLMASSELDRLVDGLLAQAFKPGTAGGVDLPPELRAALALLARSAVASARREFSQVQGR